jgi:hypothetical protein
MTESIVPVLQHVPLSAPINVYFGEGTESAEPFRFFSGETALNDKNIYRVYFTLYIVVKAVPVNEEFIQAEVPVALKPYLHKDDYKDYGCFYKSDADWADLKFFGCDGDNIGISFEPHMYGRKNLAIGVSWAAFYDLHNGNIVDIQDARTALTEIVQPKYVPELIHTGAMAIGRNAWEVVGTIKGWWKKWWN